MTKTTMYRYLGRNGIITTRVHLDGISFIPMVHLKAAAGKMLTDGEQICAAITIEAEEVNKWREITANTDK